MSFGYNFRVSRSFIATFVALIRSGDKNLYKLQNVPRIFDLRSKSSFLDHPSLSFHPHLLIVPSRSTISFSGGYKNCIKSARSVIGGTKRRNRTGSFRRVEIETPRYFTVCTLRGNWKFYERLHRCGRKRDPTFALSILVMLPTPFCPSLGFSSHNIDHSCLTRSSSRDEIGEVIHIRRQWVLYACN